jgi:hypothetical protein
MAYGRSWTAEDDTALRSYLHQGLGVDRIAEILGRSKSAIINRSILVEASTDNSKALIRASLKLREAMLDAMALYANRHGINLHTAQALLMGSLEQQRTPGTERHMKTCQVERIAA